VSDSHQNVIKLTLALSNPTIPVSRQIKRETGVGGMGEGREAGVLGEGGRRFID